MAEGDNLARIDALEKQIEMIDSDEEEETVKTALHQGGKNSYQNLKIDFKVEIPVYDGSIDVERLDDWIERMETYFTLYSYSSKEKIVFAALKLSGHMLMWCKPYCKQEKKAVSWNKFKELLRKQFYPVGFLKEHWYKWYSLRQRVNQTIQEYTMEFSSKRWSSTLR
ncbi:uncharacterized protein A4U43_C03F24840 [Asparagus officinalis]|uniref:Retrotransposon gag domain-containing protein n=1 Tax=Asparagus officinalis TaxID=4686 RepID=A0A5P1FCR0_ASPOF|nr:uncharacterized protein A4U43_C03F24840 [Asparagus officinalis]